MQTIQEVYSSDSGKKYLGRADLVFNPGEGLPWGIAYGFSARNIRDRKLIHCERAGAIRVVPTTAANPKRQTNDSLHFYNAIIRLLSDEGFIAGNGIQTDEFHRFALRNSGGLHPMQWLDMCAHEVIPKVFYDSQTQFWRTIDIMTHEPDFSGGIAQHTSRIAAAIRQKVRRQRVDRPAPRAGMIRLYCEDTNQPHCYLEQGYPFSSQPTESKVIDRLEPGHGILSTTYDGRFENGRLMPSLDCIEVILDDVSPKAIVEAFQAAMHQDQFVSSACWVPGQEPVMNNHEE